jgi:NTP pyrophosphatase (non-canonical NTP hydrolase)
MNKEQAKNLMSTQVAFTNLTFGKGTLSQDDPQFWEKLHNQAQLVKEELEELFQAIEDKNMTQVRDAVADISVTNLGVPHLAGFDCESDMLEVFDSNLSKVSSNMENALKTQEFYSSKGVKTYISPCPTFDGFIVKVSETVVGLDNKKYPKDKFLKCVVGFREPKFE